jgi:hypothetical protein
MTKVQKILLTGLLILSGILGGCYTQLMTPEEFGQVQREKIRIRSDATYSLNYNQRCVSCHTRAELDDRYFDLKYYGVTSVHGIPLDPIVWSGSDYASPYDEIYFAPQPGIILPWWLPPAATVTGQGSAQQPVNSGERIRVTGATRDSGRERDAVQAQPQSTTPVGGPAVSTPPPASTVTPTQTAAPTQQSTTGSERSRSDGSSGSGESRTRSDGSSRDDSPRPR